MRCFSIFREKIVGRNSYLASSLGLEIVGYGTDGYLKDGQVEICVPKKQKGRSERQ